MLGIKICPCRLEWVKSSCLYILPGSWQERTGVGLRRTLSVLRLSLIVGLVQNYIDVCICLKLYNWEGKEI